MLVKYGRDVVVEILVLRLFFPARKAGDEPRRVVLWEFVGDLFLPATMIPEGKRARGANAINQLKQLPSQSTNELPPGQRRRTRLLLRPDGATHRGSNRANLASHFTFLGAS